MCLGTWLGASTVMVGSVLAGLADEVAARESGAPAISKMHEQAAARLDKDLMAMSSQCGASQPYPPHFN
jgi:hypothetical protein